jgi:hypothetical protein
MRPARQVAQPMARVEDPLPVLVFDQPEHHGNEQHRSQKNDLHRRDPWSGKVEESLRNNGQKLARRDCQIQPWFERNATTHDKGSGKRKPSQPHARPDACDNASTESIVRNRLGPKRGLEEPIFSVFEPVHHVDDL